MSFLEQKIYKYLCPPGNGVFTVHTAKENKNKLHTSLYGTTQEQSVFDAWKKQLKNLHTTDKICMLGLTLDTGGGIQRGANWGPLFIRNQLLEALKTEIFDLGDIKTIPHLLHDKYLNEATLISCRKALYGTDNSLPVSGLSIAEDFCENFYELYPNKKIIGLGGDHSVSYPLVKSWLKSKNSQNIKTAIIHFDAHTDLMDQRLGIDICFASWAYHMIEFLDEPSDLIQLGIRSSGQNKEYWQSKLKVQQFWNDDFNDLDKVICDVTNYLKLKSIEEVYISFDIDALDSEYASATGTPESNGLAPHQCIHLIEEISQVTKITGADLVEVAPFVRSSQQTHLTPEPDTTLLSSKLIIDKFIEVMK